MYLLVQLFGAIYFKLPDDDENRIGMRFDEIAFVWVYGSLALFSEQW